MVLLNGIVEAKDEVKEESMPDDEPILKFSGTNGEVDAPLRNRPPKGEGLTPLTPIGERVRNPVDVVIEGVEEGCIDKCGGFKPVDSNL